MSRTLTLKMQHTSLQFSDTSKQQRVDISDLFSKGKEFPIKTGTEAGPDAPSHNMNRTHMIEFANRHKHHLHFAADNWIAIDRDIVKPKSLRKGRVLVAKAKETWGNGHDSVLCTVEFDHVDDRIGHLCIASCHYPVRGATPGTPNYQVNREYAEKIHDWMKENGRGPALAFVNGDFNMNDERTDWDFGKGFTSMGDELDKHPGTGHGPIDGFASFDKDGRVAAKWFNVLDDNEFFQHSDHFVCRGAWEIKHKRKAA